MMQEKGEGSQDGGEVGKLSAQERVKKERRAISRQNDWARP